MSTVSPPFAACPLFEPLLPTLLQFGSLEQPPSIDALNQVLDVAPIRLYRNTPKQIISKTRMSRAFFLSKKCKRETTAGMIFLMRLYGIVF